MRFIHVYGEAIVGLYLAVLPSYSYQNGNLSLNRAMKRHAGDWPIATGEPITNVLNITEFRRMEGCRDFARFHSNPTLDDALRVLIGACIVCMATLKPSRNEELTHLKRRCIRHDSNGYWFNFELGKSKVKGFRHRIHQPRERRAPGERVVVALGIVLPGCGRCAARRRAR